MNNSDIFLEAIMFSIENIFVDCIYRLRSPC